MFLILRTQFKYTFLSWVNALLKHRHDQSELVGILIFGLCDEKGQIRSSANNHSGQDTWKKKQGKKTHFSDIQPEPLVRVELYWVVQSCSTKDWNI